MLSRSVIELVYGHHRCKPSRQMTGVSLPDFLATISTNGIEFQNLTCAPACRTRSAAARNPTRPYTRSSPILAISTPSFSKMTSKYCTTISSRASRRHGRKCQPIGMLFTSARTTAICRPNASPNTSSGLVTSKLPAVTPSAFAMPASWLRSWPRAPRLTIRSRDLTRIAMPTCCIRRSSVNTNAGRTSGAMSLTTPVR